MYSTGIAYLLWLISGCGALGFHRFYLGKVPTGLMWMFSGGVLGIGSIYDFFTLPRQVREANLLQAMHTHGGKQNINTNPTRYVSDGQARIVHEKENPERAVLRIAKENKGIITASEVALAADISIDEARKTLDALVSKGYAELRVRQSGTLVYTIPDLMDNDEPLVF